MCHLDVFTAVRIIHATLWVCWYKPSHEKRASKRERERGAKKGMREGRNERRGKRWNVQEKRGLTVRRRQLGRRVDVKNQAYARSPRERRHSLFKTF